MTILNDRLENVVLPMLVVYAVVGVIVALIEIIAVVLATAFIAQVRERARALMSSAV